MQRRDFVKLSLLVSPFLIANNLQAEEKKNKPIEGKHYLKLKKLAPDNSTKEKIEVVEFFQYSCGHCFYFEPIISDWKKKVAEKINVIQIPVAWQESATGQQKLFFSLKTLPNFEELHLKYFTAIHQERKNLFANKAIFKWLKDQKVDVDNFLKIYNSFSVDSQVKKAVQLQEAYDVNGTPALGIAGKYYTDGTLSGAPKNSLALAEYLAEEVRKTL